MNNLPQRKHIFRDMISDKDISDFYNYECVVYKELSIDGGIKNE